MNKKFLSAILFGALMVSSTGTFVSCKDYDDDIDELREQIKGLVTPESLATKIAELQTAITEAKTAASTELSAAKNALQTAIDAKADAATVSALQTKVTACEDKVTTLTTQLGTLETKISTLQTELQDAIDLKADQAALNALSLKVDGIAEEVSGVLGTTLSSVTLVPDLYIGGIEAIEFKSISYIAQKQGGETGLTNAETTNTLISNGETIAKYRLNPMTVTLANIDQAGVDFVANNAEVRSVIESPVTVNGLAIDQFGILSVKCKKTTTASLIPADGTINTVALKVPRADDNSQIVYSEYARLSETTITPRIAALPYTCETPVNHYADSTTIWASKVNGSPLEMVTKEVVYDDKSLDLLTLVTGCYYESDPATEHTQITKDELKTYGLEFRFAIPATVYNTNADNRTNQQQFALLDGTKILSKIPNGSTSNRAAVGKEPIVRVTLYDVNNKKIVDQRYLKIRWIDKVMEPVALDPVNLEATLGCDNVRGEITWEDFINNVYGAIKATKPDMSEEQFHQIYPAATSMTASYNYATTTSSNHLTYDATTNEAGDALALDWDIAADEILTIDQAVGYKDMVAEVTFTPNNIDYPVLTLKLTMKVKLPVLPSINGYYDNYWFEKYNTVDVYPVQFNTAAATANCRFYNNLMNAFTYDTGGTEFIVKNLPECGNWDLQFASAQPITGVTPNYVGTDPLTTPNVPFATFGAYQLLNGTVQALSTEWDNGHTSWCNNVAHKSCYLVAAPHVVANQSLLNPLADTYKADGIVPQTTHNKKITVKVFGAINAYNIVEVKKYDVCLVAPLKIDADLKGFFEDQIVSGSAIDCSDAFTLTDFAGYEVADIADDATKDEYHKWTKSLYTYYEVETPEFDLDNVVVGMAYINGSCVVDDNITAAEAAAHMNNNATGKGLTFAELLAKTNGNIKLSITKSPDNTKLIFKNNGGSGVEQECNVFIKASVKYGFGEVSKVVSTRVYPHGSAPQN